MQSLLLSILFVLTGLAASLRGQTMPPPLPWQAGGYDALPVDPDPGVQAQLREELRLDLIEASVAYLHSRAVSYVAGPGALFERVGWTFSQQATPGPLVFPNAWVIAPTALGGLALLRAPGWDADPIDRLPKVYGATLTLLGTAIADLETGTLKEKDVGFALSFGLRFLLQVLRDDRIPTNAQEYSKPQIVALVTARIDDYVDALEEALLTGPFDKGPGLYYDLDPAQEAYAPCFVTPLALLALAEAQNDGFVVNNDAVHAGLCAVRASRVATPSPVPPPPPGVAPIDPGTGVGFHYYGSGPLTYVYEPEMEGPEPLIDIESRKITPKGSCGRSPWCELARIVWGDAPADPTEATEQFFTYFAWLWEDAEPNLIGSESGPFSIGPHFRMLSHAYTAEAVEYLPDPGPHREDLLAAQHQIMQWIDDESVLMDYPFGSVAILGQAQSIDTAFNILALSARDHAPVPVASLPPLTFVRGDVNDDGWMDISDAIVIRDYLFLDGRRPFPLDKADANDDGSVDTADMAFILNSLFSGGPTPPAPYPLPGLDPTADDLK